MTSDQFIPTNSYTVSPLIKIYKSNNIHLLSLSLSLLPDCFTGALPFNYRAYPVFRASPTCHWMKNANESSHSIHPSGAASCGHSSAGTQQENRTNQKSDLAHRLKALGKSMLSPAN